MIKQYSMQEGGKNSIPTYIGVERIQTISHTHLHRKGGDWKQLADTNYPLPTIIFHLLEIMWGHVAVAVAIQIHSYRKRAG